MSSGLSVHSGSDFKMVAVHGMLHTGGNILFSDGLTSAASYVQHQQIKSSTSTGAENTNQTDAALVTATTTNSTTNNGGTAPKLFSIVGNNITVVNLQRNSTSTLPVCNANISCFDVSPDGDLIFAVGSRGLGVFFSISAGLAIDTVSIPPNCPVRCAVFSPCGKYVALGADTTLQIYAAPAERTVSFHGCQRLENIHNAVNESINRIEWSADSSCVLISGADARIRVYPRDVRNRAGWAAAVNNLIGHRAPVVGCFWADAPKDAAVVISSQNHGTTSVAGQEDGSAAAEFLAEQEDPSTLRAISVSTDNVVIEWHRSHLRRKEVMEMIWQMKRRLQLEKRHRKSKNNANNKDGKKRKNKNGDDVANSKNNNNDNNNDDDEDEDSESDASSRDDDIIPHSFLEKQKQQERHAEGAVENAVKHRVTKGTDAHLPPAIRYGYETHKRHLLSHKGLVTSATYHRKRSLLAIGYSSGLFAIHAVLINNDTSLATHEEKSAQDALNNKNNNSNIATSDGKAGATARGTTTSTSLPLLHVLSATAQALSAASFSPKGDLVAFASAHLKQLLVWDWRGETHVLKEQSHYYDITCSAMTSDGALIVSGGDDGKAKVWRRSNGQCIASFADHLGGITGLATSAATNAFFTSSKDGTCRGFDLIRYRNFRVFQPSDSVQFSCIAVDVSGEVLAAGSSTSSLITVWSVQTGKIVEEFDGHEGPVTSLSFHSSGATLYSGATDKTLMIWDLFSNYKGGAGDQQGQALQNSAESISVPSEVLATTTSLNGQRFACLLLNGEMFVYDSNVPTELELVTSFQTNLEAAGGWAGRVGPKSSNTNSHFTTIALTPDGKKILAGGESRWIALFHAEHGYLMHKWPVTTNADILGIAEQFDFRNAMDDGTGMLTDIQTEPEDSHLTQRKLIEMPGSRHNHFATGKRKTQIAARTSHVCFAGHGRDFVAATTAGLLLFSADAVREKFAPLSLRRDLTTESVLKLLRGEATASAGGGVGGKNSSKKYSASSFSTTIEGLIGALLLQDELLIQEGLRRVSPASVALVCDSVPTAAFPRLLRSVADAVTQSDALEHAVLWAKNLLLFTSEPLFGPMRSDDVALPLRQLHKAVLQYDSLRSIFTENEALLGYLTNVVKRRSRKT